jgi:hypothetical protein
LKTVENVCSDIYLFIIVFLMQNKPFSKVCLKDYETRRNSFLKVNTSNYGSHSSGNGNKSLVCSPNLHSKFSPSISISKSPTLQKSIPNFKLDGSPGNNNILNKFSYNNKDSQDNSNYNSDNEIFLDRKSVSTNFDDLSKLTINKNTPVYRKVRNNLKYIKDNVSKTKNDDSKEKDDLEKEIIKEAIENYQMMPAFKHCGSGVIIFDEPETTEDYFEQEMGNNINIDEDDTEPVKHESHLYKLTINGNMRKLWFTLIHKDFYCK